MALTLFRSLRLARTPDSEMGDNTEKHLFGLESPSHLPLAVLSLIYITQEGQRRQPILISTYPYLGYLTMYQYTNAKNITNSQDAKVAHFELQRDTLCATLCLGTCAGYVENF